jgi:hypothetical protein
MIIAAIDAVRERAELQGHGTETGAARDRYRVSCLPQSQRTPPGHGIVEQVEDHGVAHGEIIESAGDIRAVEVHVLIVLGAKKPVALAVTDARDPADHGLAWQRRPLTFISPPDSAEIGATRRLWHDRFLAHWGVIRRRRG